MKLSKLTLPEKDSNKKAASPAEAVAAAPPTPVLKVNPCEVFLKNFLSDGPRMRTYVYREAENCNLMWEDVKAAFAAVRGREYVQKGEYFWRIMSD